ncbi:MAG TPA: acylphosphatase [Xanthomonadales bacterium]|nr:acylphosphatase [Xanthomonadales bacterium]
MPAARFLVAGRVQGVFFRAATRERARALGLSGHARNLPDGRVEVVADGDESALEALGEWLWTGSSASRVESVQREAAEATGRSGFDIA